MKTPPPWLRRLVEQIDTVLPADLRALLPPEDGSGRASAVLIAFAETARGPGVLLIQRAAALRQHAGQVAFPGGAVDPGDAHHEAAALREAQEEVGLDPASVTVLAQLPELFIWRSGYVVTPVLAWWHAPHPVAPVDAREVARAVLVPVADLVDPEHRFTVTHPLGFRGPGFEADGLFVWGFTAMLLDRLLTVGGWAQPWDASREQPVPADLVGRPTTT